VPSEAYLCKKKRCSTLMTITLFIAIVEVHNIIKALNCKVLSHVVLHNSLIWVSLYQYENKVMLLLLFLRRTFININFLLLAMLWHVWSMASCPHSFYKIYIVFLKSSLLNRMLDCYQTSHKWIFACILKIKTFKIYAKVAESPFKWRALLRNT
jgi:hypothetical protein